MRVGLTGGIGSGKSEVAVIFGGLGAHIIDADQLAREVVAPRSEGFAEVAARWPQVIRDGTIDRAALAAIVFADASEREALNAIVHPRVRARAAEIEQLAPDGVAVHVIPLLFETDAWKRFDTSVLVVAPRELRVARVAARDSLSRQAIEQRMTAQIDPEEARQRATYTIENDGDRATLESRTRAVWASLVDRDSRPPERSAR